ncbi:MAG TPA: carbohydrate ABC transporter permease [Roseiflexaceae bacterium]|nr:carbohydrate ABC transporter permease [Roseiflexaceae bacterium]HMP42344.1 carbohydrate ABC transporter permease [Roseiflexaceae bacterium]
MAVKTADTSPPLTIRHTRHVSLSDRMGTIGRYALLFLLAVTFLVPFYWMITSAMKDDSQVYVVPPVWIPNPAYVGNFISAWQVQNFNLYAFNTVFKYAIPATIGTVLSSALVAYSFARMNWPGRDFCFAVCLATMMIPFQVRLVPLFIIFKELGWINTYLPLVVPAFFANAFFIFMLRQFFRTIPMELSEAAKIDGANEITILLRVILPLAKPALTVVALFAFMDAWNDYLGPLIYINNEPEWTLALAIQRMGRAMAEVGAKSNAYPYLMAVSTIVTMPILLIFFFAQRAFIEGISLSGLKG